MTEISFDFDRELEGIRKSSRAVAGTLGPNGTNIKVKFKNHPLFFTNDGLLIAKSIIPADEHEEVGARFVQSVAEATDSNAEGGRSTAVVISSKLVLEGAEYIKSGVSVLDLVKGFQYGLTDAKELIRLTAQKTRKKDLKNVAITSSESEEIGEIIGKIVKKIGKGAIEVESGDKTEYEIIEGIPVEGTSPYEITLENPVVLVSERPLVTQGEMLNFITAVIKGGSNNILIVGEVKEEALVVVKANLEKIKVGIVQTDKDSLEDIAAATGAKLIAKGERITVEALGKAEKAIVKKKNSTIIGGFGDIKEYLSTIPKARKARLTGKVAIIRVSAPTEEELNYRIQKTRDGVSDTLSALEEGIIAGGGVGLLLPGDRESENQGIQEGYDLFFDAMAEPYTQIIKNGAVLDGDAFEKGIVDSAKTARLVLENAVSSATMYLRCHGTIVSKE